MAVMRSAVFFDKDGTLVDDLPYNTDPSRVTFADGALDSAALLHASGFLIVVVSNQSGLARGLFAESDIIAVRCHIEQSLARRGVPLAGFYYCPHHPAGVVAPYAVECMCRKPEPGLIYLAAAQLGVDTASSWFVGDILDDVEAGRRAGCRTILIDNGNETEWRAAPLRTPHAVAAGLRDAAHLILTSACEQRSA